MRAVVQKVKSASVSVDDEIKGSIGQGLLVLLGIRSDDTEEEADFLVRKIRDLRIFEDDAGNRKLSVSEAGYGILTVSQFTLYGNCRKGRNPSFSDAAGPEKGRTLYEYFVSRMQEYFPDQQKGVFGAMMDVSLVNNGPFTLVIDKNHD